MSRIGKYPVAVPGGVKVELAGQTLTAKGKLGELKLRRPSGDRSRRSRATRSCSQPRSHVEARRARCGAPPARWSTNMVDGRVRRASRQNLEINGVGYRAAVQGKNAERCSSASATTSTTRSPRASRSSRREADGHRDHGRRTSAWSARSRRRSARFRKPEPYKGKGIKYATETDPPQGRQEEVAMSHGQAKGSSSSGASSARRGSSCASNVASAGRACRCSARRKHIYAQVIDDAKGATLAAASTLDDDRQGRAQDRRRHRRRRRRSASWSPSARSQAGRHGGRVRPRRLPLSRPRQGAGRRRPRGRPVVLSDG